MDRDTFVSCFAAVALALLLYVVATYFTSSLGAAIIICLVAVILVLATQANWGNLRLGSPRRRHT